VQLNVTDENVELKVRVKKEKKITSEEKMKHQGSFQLGFSSSCVPSLPLALLLSTRSLSRSLSHDLSCAPSLSFSLRLSLLLFL